MRMGFVVLLIFIAIFRSCSCLDEPRCSKYEFEEKVLEKVIRFEHKMEIMSKSLNEISTKVKEEIHNIKTDVETRGVEQTTALNDMTETLETEWKEIKNEFEEIKTNGKIQKPSYAFSAYDLSASRPSTGPLVFTQTLLNEDGLYSSTTGKFTAPSDGVYEFHATLTPYYTNKGLYVEFKAGEKAIGRFSLFETGDYVSTSGSAIARLQKGTQVYIKITSVASGFKFREDIYRMNTFMGHLISY